LIETLVKFGSYGKPLIKGKGISPEGSETPSKAKSYICLDPNYNICRSNIQLEKLNITIVIDFPKANEKIWATFEESDKKLYELVDEKDNLLGKVSDIL
jgi:hypothetical protein